MAKTKKRRLEMLEHQTNTTFLLEGEPERGDNLLEWLWCSIGFYMSKGYIDEHGQVVPDAVSGLPEGVRRRVQLAAGVIDKLFSLESLLEAEETTGKGVLS